MKHGSLLGFGMSCPNITAMVGCLDKVQCKDCSRAELNKTNTGMLRVALKPLDDP